LEGTIAGMAAGLVARGLQNAPAVQRAPCLEVHVDGAAVDSALVDVVASSLPFVGARALWDMSVVREVVLSRVAPATIGLSALGGALLNSGSASNARMGMHIVLGAGSRQVLVPLAPGMVTWVGIREHKPLRMDDVVRFQPGFGTLALDGEREMELMTSSVVEVRLCADGPYVVDVPAALAAAAHAGLLQR
jgi:hypothetical protein